MPCTPFRLENGAQGFICSRTKAYGGTYKCACGKLATLQCDAPTRRSSGTCDRHLCTACAVEVGPDLHRCPAHVEPEPQQALF